MKHTFVRRATTEDASEVIRMTEQFCAHQHEQFWPPAKEAVVFLAEDNKQVVGMVALHTYMAGDPQISHMWVDPGHRQKRHRPFIDRRGEILCRRCPRNHAVSPPREC